MPRCLECGQEYSGGIAGRRRCWDCAAAQIEIETRTRAHVTKALREGVLTPQPCALCGNTNAVAHHDDYAKPLEVRWLCRSHHRIYHENRWRELARRLEA